MEKTHRSSIQKIVVPTVVLLAGFVLSGNFQTNAATNISSNSTNSAVVKSTPVWQPASGYATLNQAGKPVFSNLSTKATRVVEDDLLNNTYRITGQYVIDGETYYSLYGHNNHWLGYVLSSDLTKSNNAQGVWQAQSGYAKVTQKNFSFYGSFKFDAIGSSTKYYGQTVQLNSQYHHSNGAIYYSVNDLFGKWLGYINASALQKVSVTNPAGTWQADNRYVTISDKNTILYSSFTWAEKQAGNTLYGKTLHSTGKYRNLNGHTYLSVYDSNNVWQGYIDEKAVTTSNSITGPWMPASGYTTITSNNINSYSNLDKTKVKISGSKLLNQTVHITGQYHTFFGETLYSAYNNHKQWIGYLSANQIKLTSSATGTWLPASGYMTTTKKGQMMYTNLDTFASGNSTNAYYQKTYRITGMYHHFNGATYYSLYDHNGKWMGYLNSTLATKSNSSSGVWLSASGKVTISTKSSTVWSGFFTSKASTAKYFGQTFAATGKYDHYNGTTYYSLYSGKKWIGYVASNAVKPYASYHDWTKPSQSKAYPNVNAYRNLNIEVVLAKQEVYIKNGNTNLYTMYASTGVNNSTPRGHFYIQAERGYSFYNASEGMGARYWTSFLDHGVYLFHSVPTNASGNYITSQAKWLGKQPGSHGCIRLSIPDAKWINSYIKTGTPVYIH